MQTTKTYYPRIRTALFAAEGGLDHKTQYARMGIMLPTPKNKIPKLYINSVLRDRENPTAPDESLSIRLANRNIIATAFVGFVLAVREWNKIVHKDAELSKKELIKRVEAAWQGQFDAQVHPYGIKR